MPGIRCQVRPPEVREPRRDFAVHKFMSEELVVHRSQADASVNAAAAGGPNRVSTFHAHLPNGQFAEWIKSDLLMAARPADPAAGASGTAKLIGQSDDFRRYEAEFVRATDALLASGQCKAADFTDFGGWAKSSNKGAGIYFAYCRDGADPMYLDVRSGRTFR